jgi:hypothetical protein
MEVAAVISSTIAMLRADSALTALIGVSGIYKNQSRTNIRIPGIYWMVVSAVPEENEFPITVQWDVWSTTVDQQFQMEARLLALMHSDRTINFGGGVIMWSKCIDRHDHMDDEEGTYHSAMDFEYRPIREVRYSGP